MCNSYVFRLARAVAHHRIPARSLSHFYRLNRLTERSDLVWLNQNCITSFFVNATLQPFGVRHKQIIANQLSRWLDRKSVV